MHACFAIYAISSNRSHCDDSTLHMVVRCRSCDTWIEPMKPSKFAGLLGAAAFGTREITPRGRTLLTVSGVVPETIADEVARGVRPRSDYCELAIALNADVIDFGLSRRRSGLIGRLLTRVGLDVVALAISCFRVRQHYECILTDGEQVGLPYAALCRLARRRTMPVHSMIVHIMTAPKKILVFRILGLRKRIDQMLVYSSRQQELIRRDLRMPADRVRLTPFMVDSVFFDPSSVSSGSRRMIASAGLEFRDYETLISAVDGLDVDVVIAAASPWSKRSTSISRGPVPKNVTVTKFGFADLRQLYADSMFVVMPLVAVDFQAGVTTILEAMSMSRSVIVSATSGQTDVIVEGETGLYVPPGDATALRDAIVGLLNDADRRTAMGASARKWAVEHAEVSVYAQGVAEMVGELID